MRKKDIIQLIGVSVNRFMYYLQHGIVEQWPDNVKLLNYNEISGYIKQCQDDIKAFSVKPVKKPRKLKENFKLPKIYLEAQALRGYY